MAAHAKVQGEDLVLLGLYYDEESGGYLKGSLSGKRTNAEEIGKALALKLRKEYKENDR